MKFVLSKPVTVVIRSVSLPELSYSVIDDGKSATACISGFGKRLVLWDATTSPTYAQIADYTQAQIADRVSELLGDNPADVLSGLVADAQRL